MAAHLGTHRAMGEDYWCSVSEQGPAGMQHPLGLYLEGMQLWCAGFRF